MTPTERRAVSEHRLPAGRSVVLAHEGAVSERRLPAGRSAGFQPASPVPRRRTRGGGPRSAPSALLFAILLVLPLPASAQLTSAALTGRVTVTGAPAANVTVTVTSAVLQHPRTTLTNARGTYWLDSLPHGVYDVTFSRSGLTSLTRRTILQTARVARADAVLEVSEDEETTTSTARTPSVVDTTAITTHFDADTLERLPVRRDADSVASVAPQTRIPIFATVDDVFFGASGLIAEDALDEVTVVRGAVPAEFTGPAIVSRTRAPRDQFFLTLRDTLTSTRWIDGAGRGPRDDSVEHQIGLTAGGRIIPERLWFFGAAWLGEEADVARSDQRGSILKLTGALHPQHTITATHFDAQSKFFDVVRRDATATSLRYTGVIAPRATAELQAARIPAYNPGSGTENVHLVDARGSWLAGDHLVSAGAHVANANDTSFSSLFAADRWSVAQWTVYAGLRYDETPSESSILPRIAVVYDVRGNARHALRASYGEFSQFGGSASETSVGYVAAFAANGYARTDLIRRRENARDTYEGHLEGRYRLFDRFEAGGSYSYADDDFFGNTHLAAAWAALEIPLGDHELGATILQRLASGEFLGPEAETITPTDLALRYTFPLGSTRLTLAADWTNTLAVATTPRSLRFWIRARV